MTFSATGTADDDEGHQRLGLPHCRPFHLLGGDQQALHALQSLQAQSIQALQLSLRSIRTIRSEPQQGSRGMAGTLTVENGPFQHERLVEAGGSTGSTDSSMDILGMMLGSIPDAAADCWREAIGPDLPIKAE